MDHRRLGIERGFRIGDRGQRLVVDLDQFAAVLGLRARARDHGGDRLALPAGALDGDRRYCGADFRPLRCVSTPTQGVITLASSAPVTTAITPGDFFADVGVDRS